MDLTRYKELKDKGTAKLQRLGPDVFQLITPRYDPATGVKLAPEITPCNVQGVDQALVNGVKQSEQIQKAVESLNVLKADMSAAEAADQQFTG